MRRFVACLVVTGALAGLAGGAFAQDDAKEKKKADPEKQFKAKDADGDGFLSKAEFLGNADEGKTKGLERRFAAADKNGDGKLSLEEFKNAPAGKGKGKGKNGKDKDK